MNRIILLLMITCSFSFGKCHVSSSCEKPLAEMSAEAQKFIDYSFGNLDSEIENTKEEYEKFNEELDKEIHVLKIQLEAEKLLSKKITRIEALTKKTVEFKDLDTSVLYNIIEATKPKEQTK
ncbi:hypothetical protein [Poseidonibacter ostreae]|uniref:Uncharacterized protein n=1 Tax=Poseidonibacter ostreae TaxID=2654171 RepID=A0A6L4WW81_9BACT|nr:hypothetical protein [Poseidonibacter ostreae]KAB7891296.1 hypothetical protein GBG19_00235 [Poseidonibacter ostreae]